MSIVIGGGLGYVLSVLLSAVGGLLPERIRWTLGTGQILFAYPLARLFTLIPDWPFEAELAMVTLVIAIPTTFVLVGMMCGWASMRWRP